MIFIFFNVIIILGDNMKKGFTLIELLGVIVLLGILSMLAVPVINRTLNQGKDNLYKVQKKQLVKALKNYYTENTSLLNDISDGGVSCKTVGELKSLGYLPTDLKDPRTSDDLSEVLEICVKKEINYDCGADEPCVRVNPKYTYFVNDTGESSDGE